MMRLTFTADEGEFATEYALVCAVAGSGRYLALQRNVEDSDDDWGIHLEYDDQSNGDYGCVAACRVDGSSLSIDLARQLGGLAGVTGFDVALQLSPEQLAAVRAGLQRVFRGHLDMLTDAEPGTAHDPASKAEPES